MCHLPQRRLIHCLAHWLLFSSAAQRRARSGNFHEEVPMKSKFAVAILSVMTLPTPIWGQALDPSSFESDSVEDLCVIVTDMDGNSLVELNGQRCHEYLPPCSTFKYPNAVAALEFGAISTEYDVLPFPGGEQYLEVWEHDHHLASAFENSVLWFFQETTRRIGVDQMEGYLGRIGYGTGDIRSTELDRFWLDGTLRVTAHGQVDFLRQLYSGTLPVSSRSQRIVGRIAVHETGPDWEFSGKTGTCILEDDRHLGWYIGHLTDGDRELVFAANAVGDGLFGSNLRELLLSGFRANGLLD
ncbi:MAG: class D beta-lactamase, partial [Myxococcales bacterium]|nr:class D beta-lactamase [Myxococcales bacterium]